MSTLLTPIITQLEIDRDRFKILINGDELDTVQLENRIEKSISGQVKDRIDSLAISLTDAVDMASAARDDAISAKDTAETARDQAVMAQLTVDESRDQAVDAAATSKLHRDDAETFRDEAAFIAESIGAQAEYLPRYEVYSREIDSIDQVLDIAIATVWRIDGTTNWSLSFPDPSDFTYGAERSQSVIVFIEGSGGTITWPVEISWAGGNEPELGTTWTNIVLFWTGSMWIGMESAKR